jgi:electron transfer flavoprotein-quinone oxidoreductase
MPRLYGDGVVVVGDAAGFVNPLNREGVNLAMLSGKLAAQTITEAVAANNLSAAALSRYRELLEQSVVLKDLYAIRNLTSFAHARPHALREYPRLAAAIAQDYLTVDGTPKREKYAKMLKRAAGLPKRRLLRDLGGALAAFGR